MSAIIDLALLAILIICTWCGYKKGILMGLGGILCIIIAIYGGNLLANLFSYDVASAMRPFASGYTESLLTGKDSKVLKQMGWENQNLSVEDLVEQHPEQQLPLAVACYKTLGLNDVTAEHMAEEAVRYARESDGSAVDAIVHILCRTLSYVGCFILAFLLIIILLTVIGNLPNLSYKIPNLDLFNDIGGAVLGVVTGLMFCVTLVWALKYLGMILGSETLASSIFGGRLLGWDPLYQYLNF